MEMMTEAHLQTVMGIIGYTFQFENYLSLALTAAGAEDDNYDGNRGLAQVGTSLIEFLLVFKGYDAKSVRSKVQKDFRAQYSNNNHCAMLARRTGIDRCIKYNPRSGRGSKKVEARAMNAIIAAVYLDCMDTTTVQEVMQRIGFFAQENAGVNIQQLMLGTTNTVEPVPSVEINVGYDLNPISYPNLGDFEEAVLPSYSTSNLNDVNPSDNYEAENITMAVNNAANSFEDSINIYFGTGATEGDESGYGSSNLFGQNEVFEAPNLVSVGIESSYLEALTTSILHNNTGQIPFLGLEPMEYDRSLLAYGGPQSVSAGQSTSIAFRTNHQLTEYSVSDAVLDAATSSKAQPEKRKSVDIQMATSDFVHISQNPKKLRSIAPADDAHTKRQNELGMEKERAAFEKIEVHIASPLSVTILQDIIRNCRAQTGPASWKFTQQLSPFERYRVIESMDQNIAYLHLLKRYHILQLFEECGGANTRSSVGIVLTTPQDFENPQKRLGNPEKNAKADLTRSMLKTIFPDLQQDTSEYKAKYKVMTRLRKLGGRLYILSKEFGRGIIGLMPNDGLTGLSGKLISDDMIIELHDATFVTFVEYLNKTQGDSLRRFSAAAYKIIDLLLSGQMKEHEPLPIEKVESNEILEYEKGSQELLRIISAETVIEREGLVENC